ncbi:M10 family metallopeptidase C-terminal domain-containing protein [Bosea sp. LjRoot9]|uniref:calcium-binding protein n=1 Tax=Bosea sp. LjRoot9 TaxID=3342341 RepID=UPI003ECDFF35
MYDISALQYLYGSASNNTENNTYSYAGNVLESIWDTGGIDTLSAQGLTSEVVLNLNDTAFSSIGPWPNRGLNAVEGPAKNISIAKNVEIENATGGSANDLIIGNELKNELKGGAGNDVIFGDEVEARRQLGDGGPFRGWLLGDDLLEVKSYQAAGTTDAQDNDKILGEAGEDWVFAGRGDDEVDGGAGNDFLDGGAESDTAVYDGITGEITLRLKPQGEVPQGVKPDGSPVLTVEFTRSGQSGAEIDQIRNFETARFGDGTSSIHLKLFEEMGGENNKIIKVDAGSGSEDKLDLSGITSKGVHLDGGDTLKFGGLEFSGFEKFVLTAEADTFSATSATKAVDVNGGGGDDNLEGGGADDILAGGDGNDTLNGGEGQNKLSGGDGNDELRGGTEGNVFDGGAGSDSFHVNPSDRVLDSGVDDKLYLGDMNVTKVKVLSVGREYADFPTDQYLAGYNGFYLGYTTPEFASGRDAFSRGPIFIHSQDNLFIYGPGGAVAVLSDYASGDFGLKTAADMSYVETARADYDSRPHHTNSNFFVTPYLKLLAYSVKINARLSDANPDNDDLALDAADQAYVDSLFGISGEARQSRAAATGSASDDSLNFAQEDSMGFHQETSLATNVVPTQVAGTAAFEVLQGTEGNDEISGGGGIDLLIGGGGSDTYLYRPVDGSYYIAESASGGGEADVLQFQSLNSADIEFVMSGSDLILFARTFDDPATHVYGVDRNIFIFDQFSGDGESGIEQIIFADGTIWDRAQIAARAASTENHAPTDLLWSGSAVTEVSLRDRFVGQALGKDPDGTHSAYYYLTNDANGRFRITADGYVYAVAGADIDFETASSHEITVGISDSGGLTFEKSFTISVANGPEIVGTSSGDNLTGTAAGEVIYGRDGNDRIDGGGGDDSLAGGSGNDVYVFGDAFGNDFVFENYDATAIDAIEFGAGVAPADLILKRVGDNIRIALPSGASIEIHGQFAAEGPRIQEFRFADLTIWTALDIQKAYLQQAGTDGNDYLVGFDADDVFNVGAGDDDVFAGEGDDNVDGGAGDDVLSGGGGSDAIIGGVGDDQLSGGEGADLFVFEPGFGKDVISDFSPHQRQGQVYDPDGDKLVFDRAVFKNFSEVMSAAIQAGPNTIIYVDNDNYITLNWVKTSDLTEDDFDFVGEEPTWDATIIGTTASETIEGTAIEDIIFGKEGDDTISGSAGGDVYIYRSGDGSDTINDGAGYTDNVDVLRFTNLNASDLSLTRAGDDLKITVIPTGEVITVAMQFYSTTESWGIERFDFADGTSWDLATINANAAIDPTGDATVIGTQAGETVLGTAIEDIIFAKEGDDVITGGAGGDVYIYRSVDGSDTIADEAGYTDNVDVLRFTDLNASDLSLTRVGDTLKIAIIPTGELITVERQFYSTEENWGIERFDFADGTSWDLTTINANAAAGPTGDATIVGTSAGEVIAGTGVEDIIFGKEGDDQITGSAGGDIYIYRSGDGSDTIDDLAGYTDNVDVLRLTDLNAADISLVRDGDKLKVTVTSTGEVITIDHQFYSTTENWGIERFDFADGTSWDLATINASAVVDPNGAPTVVGTSGNDILVGSAGVDVILGDTGDDEITGGAGNDTLDGGAGADTLIGGVGNDIYLVDNASDVVTEAAAEGMDEIRTSLGAYTLSANVENLTYTGSGSFAGTGNGSANVITGGSGDDTLDGGAGADTLIGGAGNDIYIVDDASDIVTEAAAEGTDEVRTSLGAYTLAANVENLTYTGSGNFAGTGNDSANVITGGAGDDTLDGGAGADTLDGMAGSDTASYATSAAAVTVNLATGINTGGDAEGDILIGIENLVGSAFDDSLTGDAGNNGLTGGAGNDTLDGGAGADTLIGGAGDDIYLVDNASDIVTEAAAEGTDEVRTSLGAYTLTANVENLTYTGSGNFAGTGNSGANVITGGAGDDTLIGGAGADTLIGGLGSDTASYSGSSAAVTANLATGVATGGHAAGDVFAEIENLTGSSFGDSLTGDAAVNSLSGGAGNDTLVGGAGADTLDGGANTDTASYAASASAVTVNLATGVNTGGDAEGDVLISIENLVGSAFDDTLRGNGSANVLTGGAGADTLDGGAGGDTLAGGTGDDIYLVDNAADVVTEAAAEGTDEIRTSLGAYTLSANVENLTYTGTGDFTGTGDGGANLITGGSGNDTLIGAGGADTLNGAGGSDTASYTTSAAAVTVDLATGVNTGGDAEGDVLISIENLIGSAFDDTLSGDVNNNALTGGAGNDTLNGGAGADTLDGGTGADTLVGGIGDDIYVVDNVSDVVTEAAGEGTDEIRTSLGAYTLSANLENLSFIGTGTFTGTGNASANVITAGAGDDILIGAGGADTLNGAAGSDAASYAASAAAVTVNLATGVNTGGDAAGDTLTSIENLIGSAFADSLTGDGANNVLTGGAGADTLDGAAGSDTASYAGSTAAVTVNLLTGVNTGGDAQGDVLTAIENLIGSSLVDTLKGNASANVIEGGAGADTIDGDAGSDTASYVSSNAAVTVNLTLSTQSGGHAQGDVLTNIENIIGSAYADTLTGNTGVNVLSGGGGNDTLIGGAGADTLNGDDGSDTASYAASGAGVAVNLATNVNTGGDAAGDLLFGVENVTGSESADTLIGDAGANILRGGGGADLIQGGAGADTLDGGSDPGSGVGDTVSYASSGSAVSINFQTGVNTGGDAQGDVLSGFEFVVGSAYGDTFTTANNYVGYTYWTGGAGDDLYVINNNYTYDLVTEAANAGTDEVRVSVLGSYTLTANVENLTYTGTGGFTGTGNTLANIITGGNGNDTLVGGGGADTLIGGAGTDTASYYGGAGVTVNLATGVHTGDAAGDVFIGIEVFQGSESADTLIGDAGANILRGGGGADLIQGGAGADTLDGGSDPGSGVGDTVSYASSGSAVSINFQTGVNTGGDAQGDVLSGFEFVVGSAYGDTFTTANNYVGYTYWTGGAGDDLYVINNNYTYDLVTEAANAGTDEVRVSVLGSYTLTANVENLTYTGTGGFTGTGNTLANIITGGNGNDTLIGAGGADTLIGGAGTDTASYYGGAGVTVNLATGVHTGDAAGDVFIGIEVFQGSESADTLIGDAGANILRGGGGADLIQGGAGADTLDGGSDPGSGVGDTVSYASSGSAVSINFQTGVNTGGDAQGDVLSGFEFVVGSAYGDTFTTANNYVGYTYWTGGAGDDLYVINNNYTYDLVTEAANAGTDEVRVSVLGSYTLTANVENLTYTGTGGFTGTGNTLANIITGGNGNDTLVGGGGADTLIGGAGTDTASYYGGAGVTVNLATGVHTGDAAGDVFIGIEVFQGSESADTLIGDAGANILRGGGGADLIQGGAGADTLDGGSDPGSGVGDTVSYASSGSAVSINFQTGVNTGGDAQGDVLSGFEFVVGSAYGDTFTTANNYVGYTYWTGGAGDDLYVINNNYTYDLVTEAANAGTDEVRVSVLGSYTLTANVENLTYTGTGGFTGTGNTLANIITGGNGNDTLIGAGGADTLIGGAGTDTASYYGGAGVTVNLATGVHTGDAAGDVFIGIEVFQGSESADTLIGDAGANILRGGGGADLIQGGAGADTLDGGSDPGSGVGDTVSYASSGSAVSINFQTGVNTGGDAQGDVLSGFEFVVGSAYGDTFTTANNYVGYTYWTGGAGDDLYVINNNYTYDLVTEAANAGTDEVRVSVLGSYTLTANVENLTYTGTGGFTGTGNTLANIITGGNGNDTLVGGGGADTLIGGAGNDTLTGGTESDSFIFVSGFGKDTITDFVAGAGSVDVIEFDDAVFANLSSVLAAASQVGADTLITYDANTTITLKNVTMSNLHADDFRFV